MYSGLKPQKCSPFINRIFNHNKIIIGCTSAALLSSIATAGTMGGIAPARSHQHVISLFGGGFASAHAGHSQSYLGTDDNVFSYSNNGHSKNSGLVGGFLGEEFNPLKFNPSLFLQAGIEYTYFGNNHLHGSNTVGIEPNTSTLYHYGYTLQSQQLLAVAKILTTTHQFFHPYLSAGLGVAFNHAGEFGAHTYDTGSVNLTPTFNGRSNTEFSYALGAGVDATISEHVRLGLGYRLSDLGKTSLGNGRVIINNYSFPTAFTLVTQRMYANQIVAQLSYLA